MVGQGFKSIAHGFELQNFRFELSSYFLVQYGKNIKSGEKYPVDAA